MSMPDISVVMSVYNNADTLRAALDSILSQEGVSLEFIVVDDGSTDGSGAILDEVAKTDPRLKVVHKRNEGLTRALIDGCALASAPWIARQDADDISLPGRLKAQLHRARQPDTPDLVVCAAECRSPEGLALYDVHPPRDDSGARKKILERRKTLCPHGAILIRTNAYRAVDGYQEPFYYVQDLDLITRMAEQGRIGIVSEVLYAFNFSPSSISGLQRERQEEYRRLAGECHGARMRGESEAKWLEEAASLTGKLKVPNGCRQNDFEGLYFIGCCLRRNNPNLAQTYLARAIWAKPWSGRALLRWLEAGWRRIYGGAR